jgi:predicted cobalt transporter CbtA
MRQGINWRMVGRNAALTALALGLAALLPGAHAAGPVDIATGALAGTVLALLYFSASMLGSLSLRQHATNS